MTDDGMLVSIERRADGVALVRLDNGKVNALSIELLRQLEGTVGALADDLPGAVVVTGSERMFAAGADIEEFGGPEEAAVVGRAFCRALDALAALPRATIAAVNGFALGGGCELALACDLRVAATNAKLGQPEVLLGIIPGGGGTQRLTRLVGPSRAKDMILSGRQVKADEALRIGLADEVVPGDELMGRALARAAELLQPGGVLVVAVPNSDSLQARVFGDRWFALDLPRHLVHLPAETLVRRLNELGLRRGRVSHLRGGQVVFG